MTAAPEVARRDALEAAARVALRAPSVFNTQPWSWRVGASLQLRADPGRRLPATDPDDRLMLLSCGAALHHARVALAAAGWAATVERLPDPGDADLLARITPTGRVAPDPAARELADAVPRRRTDRRAFGARPVADATLAVLRRAVEAQGAYLHVVPADRVAQLGAAASRAAEAERGDPAYRAELTRWTSRPAWTGDGVPPATAVRPALRRVPVRDVAPDGSAGLTAGGGHDAGAAYVVLFGTGDTRLDLLRGGEALSVLLLSATAAGLATAPLSDVVEVGWTRGLLRELIAGVGEPYVAVRLGYAGPDAPPATPRRAAGETVTVDA